MAREDVAALYKKLVESEFSFIPKGQHSLQDVYTFVKVKFPDLCDDSFLCAQNCRGGSNAPEWQHVVRKSLHELMRIQSHAVNHVQRGIWLFTDVSIFESETVGFGSIDPHRVTVVTSRIERNAALAKWLKEIYNYKCQICGETIKLPYGKRYAEVHHLRPLGEPHNGPDILENMIVVCPNHHVMCDYGSIKLLSTNLRICPQHRIGDEFIDYHNNHIFQEP